MNVEMDSTLKIKLTNKQIKMNTKNYDLFKFKSNNRPVRNSHVETIAKSILEIGYIKSMPVIVDKNYYIIDGQHRFNACKKLGIPVHFSIEDIDSDTAMVNLNKSQSVWRLSEYVKYHADNGIVCYKILQEFESKYKLGISNTILIFSNGYLKATSIRKGDEFKINKNAMDIIDFILQCKKIVPFALSARFVQSITYLFRTNDRKIIDKVLDNIMLVKACATASDYLLYFENIINKGRMPANRVSLTV